MKTLLELKAHECAYIEGDEPYCLKHYVMTLSAANNTI